MNIETLLLDATILPIVIAWSILVGGAIFAALISR